MYVAMSVRTIACFSPSCRIKVALHKVVKRPHVFFFRKQDMVCDALQDLKEMHKCHLKVDHIPKHAFRFEKTKLYFAKGGGSGHEVV